MDTQTNTPETDREKWTGHCGDFDWQEVVGVHVARRLERERDELKNYLDAAHYKQCNSELRAEVARLRGKKMLVSVNTGAMTTISEDAMICPDCGTALLHQPRRRA